MTNLGTPDNRLEMNGEQLHAVGGTGSLQDGQLYVSGDTVYWSHNGSQQSVVARDLGTSGSNVTEALRIQRPDGTAGYLPMAPVANATYPEIRLQHNGSVFGLHDSTTASGGGTTIPDSVVDQFEDGDLSEYGYVDSPFEATQARAFEGSWSIRDDHPEQMSDVWAVSTSGLPNYPEAGKKFEYRNYIESSSAGNPDATVCFAAQSESSYPDGYYLTLGVKDGDCYLTEASSGTTLGSTGTAPPQDEWLRVLVDWTQSGDFTVEIYRSNGDLFGSFSASDSTHSSGGIGFSCNYHGAVGGSGLDEEVYWDSVLTQ